MKHDKLLAKAGRFNERILPPVHQIPAKGNGAILRNQVSKEHIKDASIKKAVLLADACRNEIEKLGEIADPRKRKEKGDQLRNNYLSSIEKLKSDRVNAISKKLDGERIRWEDGHRYARPEAIHMEALTLEKAKLRSLTMSSGMIDAAIGAADKGVYSEPELLALAPVADERQRTRIGQVLENNPPWIATQEAQTQLAELTALTSAGAGHLPYIAVEGGDFITTNALELLNNPDQKKNDPRAKDFQALRDGLQRAEAAKDRETIKQLLSRIEELEKEKEPTKVK